LRPFLACPEFLPIDLLLKQLMSDDQEGCSQTTSKIQNEISCQLVSVGDGKWQVLKENEDINIINTMKIVLFLDIIDFRSILKM
jgi:hypothetical protein